MIKKDDSQSIPKIVKLELNNMIKKDDSQSILKIVKPELSNVVKKDSLNLTATKRYIDIVHGQKAVNVLEFSFDDEKFLNIPMNVEVIKYYSTANLKD
ncbi:hypothetical protein BDFB_013432, partial [Asbolus verrucosus]